MPNPLTLLVAMNEVEEDVVHAPIVVQPPPPVRDPDEDVYRLALLAGSTWMAQAASFYLRRRGYPIWRCALTLAPPALLDAWWIHYYDRAKPLLSAAAAGSSSYFIFRDAQAAALAAGAWLAVSFWMPHKTRYHDIATRSSVPFQNDWSSQFGVPELKMPADAWWGEWTGDRPDDRFNARYDEQNLNEAPPNFQQSNEDYVQLKDSGLNNEGVAGLGKTRPGLAPVENWNWVPGHLSYNPNGGTPPFNTLADIIAYARDKNYFVFTVAYDSKSTSHVPYPDFNERNAKFLTFYQLLDREALVSLPGWSSVDTESEVYVHPALLEDFVGRGWVIPREAVIGARAAWDER